MDRDAQANAWAGLEQSSARMRLAMEHATRMAGSARPLVCEAAQSALHHLERLRAGWNEMGLWAGAGADGQSVEEVAMADEELRYRLRSLERNCLWQLASLEDADTAELAPLWAGLAG
jgi:hypothetical protein